MCERLPGHPVLLARSKRNVRGWWERMRIAERQSAASGSCYDKRMTSWNSPEFVLTPADISRTRWLSLRSGPILLRLAVVCQAALWFGPLILGPITGVVLLVNSGVVWPLAAWAYFLIVIAISIYKARRKTRQAAQAWNAAQRMPRRYTLDERGLVGEHAGGWSFIGWPAVRDIVRTRHGLYVMHANILWHIIPRRCFQTRQELDDGFRMASDLRAKAGAPGSFPTDIESRLPDRPPDVQYELKSSDIWPLLKTLEIWKSIGRAIGFTVVAAASVPLAWYGIMWGMEGAVTAYLFSALCWSIALSFVFVIIRRRQYVSWGSGCAVDIWVTPDYFVCRSASVLHFIPWKLIGDVRMRGDFVTIGPPLGLIRAIPLSSWPTPQHAQLFVDELCRRKAEAALDTPPQPDDVWPPAPRRTPL